MFFIKALISFCFLLISADLFAVSFDQRGLLIFIDDYEKNLGLIVAQVLIALSQDAGPMIVSTSILVNAYEKYHCDHLNVLFDSSKWILKNVNDLLCLLIPKSYFIQRGISVADAQTYGQGSTTPLELKVGLKVNHMRSFELKDVKEIFKRTSRALNENYFASALEDPVTKESLIFCLRKDYKDSDEPRTVWVIYFSGHGLVQKLVAGLSIESYKFTLDFFEKKIYVRLLINSSCYAAGLNNKLIFDDALSGVQKTYSYAIITEAITDAATSLIINTQDEKLTDNQKLNFQEFIQTVAASDTIDFKQIVTSFFPLYDPNDWANIPQIKLPGLEWFSVLASQKDIVSIGSILAQSRDPNKPLDIVSFFKTEPKALLLYAEDIPFALTISTNSLQAVISMVPGIALHRLKKVTFAHYTQGLPTVWARLWGQKSSTVALNKFMALTDLGTRKYFFIEDFNGLENVIIANSPPSPQDESSASRHAMFIYKNVLYNKFVGKTYERASAPIKKIYDNLMIDVKKSKENISNEFVQNIKKINDLLANEQKREAALKRIEQSQKKRELEEELERQNKIELEKEKELQKQSNLEQENMKLVQALKNSGSDQFRENIEKITKYLANEKKREAEKKSNVAEQDKKLFAEIFIKEKEVQKQATIVIKPILQTVNFSPLTQELKSLEESLEGLKKVLMLIK